MIQWLAARAIPWKGIGLVALFLLPWGVTWWQAYQRGKAETSLAVAAARLAASEAAGKAQAERASLDSKAWQNVAERLYSDNGKTMDRLAAITADSVSLAGRLRDHENRLRAGAVSGIAGGAAGAPGAAGVARGQAEIDAALDAYDVACQRDAERLAYWVALWPKLSTSDNTPNSVIPDR